MSDVLDRIVARIAPRIAAMLAESDAALIHGPHEFRPVEIVETALNSIGGAYRRHRVTAVDDVAALRRSVSGRRPVLIEWVGEDPETRAALERLLTEVMAPGALAAPVIAVAEVDADRNSNTVSVRAVDGVGTLSSRDRGRGCPDRRGSNARRPPWFPRRRRPRGHSRRGAGSRAPEGA